MVAVLSIMWDMEVEINPLTYVGVYHTQSPFDLASIGRLRFRYVQATLKLVPARNAQGLARQSPNNVSVGLTVLK